MIELVTDDSVLRGKDCLKEAGICIEAGGVQNCVCCPMEVADFAFQSLVQVLCGMSPGSNATACPNGEKVECKAADDCAQAAYLCSAYEAD